MQMTAMGKVMHKRVELIRLLHSELHNVIGERKMMKENQIIVLTEFLDGRIVLGRGIHGARGEEAREVEHPGTKSGSRPAA